MEVHYDSNSESQNSDLMEISTQLKDLSIYLIPERCGILFDEGNLKFLGEKDIDIMIDGPFIKILLPHKQAPH